MFLFLLAIFRLVVEETDDLYSGQSLFLFNATVVPGENSMKALS